MGSRPTLDIMAENQVFVGSTPTEATFLKVDVFPIRKTSLFKKTWIAFLTVDCKSIGIKKVGWVPERFDSVAVHWCTIKINCGKMPS